MSTGVPVPAGEITQRILHFFWIADYSGSMSGKKIATLNQAIREALPEVRKALASHPDVALMMRAVKFSDTASWHVGPQPVPLERFVWPELSTAGGTSTAQAIRLLAAELTLEKMPRRGCPPVCILISDGYCTEPAGEFWMGSPDKDPDAFDDEKPRHNVRISEAFYLGVTPVTQAQYEAVMGKNPSHFQGRPNNPVESVSWFEAVRFCNELSWKEGLLPYYSIRGSNQVLVAGGSSYRLPTEAEWEYACRAGPGTRYCFGDDKKRLGVYACYSPISGGRPYAVGQGFPNDWGLYDMHGEVWEWCWDGFDEGYYRQSPDVDPPGPDGAACRVSRGGSWNDVPRDARSASRLRLAPHVEFNYVGFRVARDGSGQ
jgi:formylglycine-generating enzyme required for sulfatase activity